MGSQTAAVALLAGLFLSGCNAGPQAARSSEAVPYTEAAARVSIVPYPRVLHARAGWFTWHDPISISAPTGAERREAAFVVSLLQHHGIAASVSDRTAGIRLRIDPRARDLGEEGYALESSSGGIEVRAGGAAGLFYGIQTLEQLTAFAPGQPPRTELVSVRDRPAYRWRGIHLDVSRHFFDVATVERYIDLAAHYKLNVLHWHLTDDRAWRLQIRAYPLLTREASYTQSDVRGVVAYAQARHVTVVPEIEMPGHLSAALAAYPALAGTRRFETTVLREVLELFPSRYVHIGGDEVLYTPARAAFMRNIATFLEAHHRIPIAWDDVLAAHPDPAVTLTVWHAAAGAAASNAGHDFVMSPDGPLYFDAYQGDRRGEPPAAPHLSTLSLVYDYDPMPDAPSVAFRSHLLGVQANIWTEKIVGPDRLFYMALPRELALAEIAWDTPARKNWDRFVGSLPAQFAWLDARGYVYRVPNVSFAIAERSARFAARPGSVQSAIAAIPLRAVHVGLSVPLEHASIHYTTDGSEPTLASPEFRTSVSFALRAHAPLLVRAAAYLPGGRRSATTECVFVYGTPPPSYRSRWFSGLVSP